MDQNIPTHFYFAAARVIHWKKNRLQNLKKYIKKLMVSLKTYILCMWTKKNIIWLEIRAFTHIYFPF